MNIFTHEGTTDLPSIILDKRDSVFEISGTSFPEDAREFYSPVLEWVNEYLKAPNDHLALSFRLTYYNTSTSKIFHTIMEKFEYLYDEGYNISIKWFYDLDDEDMYEAGLGYKDRISIPIELVSF